jgi:hypothetical protein
VVVLLPRSRLQPLELVAAKDDEPELLRIALTYVLDYV